MIDVVAGILRDQGRVLIAQRPRNKHQGLKWEFPGGKPENNETDEDALIREFQEELDIEVQVQDFLCEVIYEYPKMKVKIRAYFISSKDKDMKNLEHESVELVDVNELKKYDLVAADVYIVDKILEKNNE